VTVTATRLADRGEDAREVPASTTVITRAEIEASGARTVQEALSRIAGVNVFDQTGNAIQTTLDLRGFTGSGLTVLLDGARLNDPRSNSVPLETIGVDGIERIQVTRGPRPRRSEGSAGGVVNIVSGSAGTGAPDLTAAWGTYNTGRLALGLSGASGSASPGTTSGTAPASGGSQGSTGSSGRGIDWLISASRDRTDGFRENADARLDRYTGSLGFTVSPRSRFMLTLHGADNEIGAPGALTLAEWEDDPTQSPFNSLDNSDLTSHQATALWHGPDYGPFSFAANLSYLAELRHPHHGTRGGRRVRRLPARRKSDVVGAAQSARSSIRGTSSTW
jgi:outer membrane receptor for Fe3+-dicitrate